MKSLMLIAFCSAVLFASVNYSEAAVQSLHVGMRANSTCFADKLVVDELVEMSNSFKRCVLKPCEETKHYPQKGQSFGRITRIEVVDQKKKGSPTVEVVGGGIGYNKVSLHFRNRDHGFSYKVKIYAIPKN